jgi:hypothetical protein
MINLHQLCISKPCHGSATKSIPLDSLVPCADTARKQRSPGKDDQGPVALYTISCFCFPRSLATHVEQGSRYRPAGDVACEVEHVRAEEAGRRSGKLTNSSSEAEKRI